MQLDRGTTLTSEDHMDWLENKARLADERAQKAEAEAQRHKRLLHLLTEDAYVAALVAAPGPRCLFWGFLAGLIFGWGLADFWTTNP